ncbi:hypothetical protein [Candidatus Chlorohelix sp.]|uniref:hypothetical protein n=1 Tax=Candidatus Chlorohelix sp. TaxID=3139201 RepID=UPI003023FBB8
MYVKLSFNNNQPFKFTGPFRFSTTDQSLSGVIDYNNTETITAIDYGNTLEYKGNSYRFSRIILQSEEESNPSQE